MESNRSMNEVLEHPEGQPKRRRSLPVSIWWLFGLIFLVICIYFGPQTITYVRLRPAILRPADSPPRGWSSVPVPLHETTASTVEGSTISLYGHQFEAPWKEIEGEEQGERIRFKPGQIITFYNPELTAVDPINAQIVHITRAEFETTFGAGPFQSKYDQFNAILSARPSEWSPFRTHRNFARFQTLLEIKGLWFEHNVVAPEIFSFETTNYRGFELSGLSHDWQNVTLNLFDVRDRRFVMNIKGDSRSGVKITQPEINRIIQSFRPAQPKIPSQ